MGSRANKDDLLVESAAIQSVDQQEVTANVALAMVGPIPHERMVKPLRPEWSIVGQRIFMS